MINQITRFYCAFLLATFFIFTGCGNSESEQTNNGETLSEVNGDNSISNPQEIPVNVTNDSVPQEEVEEPSENSSPENQSDTQSNNSSSKTDNDKTNHTTDEDTTNKNSDQDEDKNNTNVADNKGDEKSDDKGNNPPDSTTGNDSNDKGNDQTNTNTETKPDKEPPPDGWAVPAKYKSMKNPTKADGESYAVAKTLWAKHCKSCHGKAGKGDGPKAGELDTPSGDFSSAKFQSQTDGSLFYKTSEGRGDMPGFKKKIPDDEDRWFLVNYLRTFK